MKKINVLVIAAVLIAVHLLIFAAFVGKKNDQAPAAAPPAEQPAEPIPNTSGPDLEATSAFEVPKLDLLETIGAEVPAETPGPAAPVREVIATPGRRDGYLRSDQPEHRTTQNYDKLVGDPFQGEIVVDARTGRILYERRAGAYAYPASVTKLMTLLIVLEQIDAGKISLDDKVAITDEVAKVGGSEVYLDVRESGAYTVHNLLQCLMIHSANDSARALALHVAGNRDAFVDMMNRKARELGMNSTVYHSEHGLPPDDGSQPDISTAYDIAILSLAVLKHPKAIEYSGTKLAYLPTSPIRDEQFMLANRNVLISKDPYPGCDGLKTGYHARGGYSLAATAVRGDDRVVAVILGVPDSTTRTANVRELLDKGFAALRP